MYTGRCPGTYSHINWVDHNFIIPYLRLARGKSTTFTHYLWDQESVSNLTYLSLSALLTRTNENSCKVNGDLYQQAWKVVFWEKRVLEREIRHRGQSFIRKNFTSDSDDSWAISQRQLAYRLHQKHWQSIWPRRTHFLYFSLFPILLDIIFPQNYLHQKSITISDWIRATYHEIWLTFQISNKYRYDHFIGKSDFLYDFEKAKLALNPQGKH